MANPFLEESGITHPNLGGAQVMDAGWEVFNPGYWWQKGSDWEHGTDHAKEYEIPWKFWEQDREPLGGLRGLGTMGQAQMSTPEDGWRRQNADVEYNRAQMNLNEPRGRAFEWELYRNALEAGVKPSVIDGQLYPRIDTVPDTSGEFPGDYLHWLRYPTIEEPELIEAQSQWKRPDNMEKTIKSLELRPEFEGWTHDEIKYWIINQARANRGGIIGLL